jgi:hypothetical protein
VLDLCQEDYATLRRTHLSSSASNGTALKEKLGQKTSSQGWDDNAWVDSDQLMADISFRRDKLLRSDPQLDQNQDQT